MIDRTTAVFLIVLAALSALAMAYSEHNQTKRYEASIVHHTPKECK